MYQGLAYDIDAVMPAAVATGLFISRLTFQAPDGNFTTSGAPSGAYANVPGLVNIQCMDAPMSEARIQATETKELDDILSKRLRHVALDGSYPAAYDAADLGWRAIVDGVTYDVLGVEPDSQRTQTRVSLQIASV